MSNEETKRYHVVADFKDRETGELVLAGSTIEVHHDRLQAYLDAQVIGKEVIEVGEAIGEDQTTQVKEEKKDKKQTKKTSGDPDAGNA